jgi:hypothetical protein
MESDNGGAIIRYQVRSQPTWTASSYPLSFPKVYRTRIWLKVLLLLFSSGFLALAILAIMSAPNTNKAENVLPAIGFLIFAVISIISYLMQNSCRLVLSPEGLTWYTIGFRMFTPWHNLSGFGSTRLFGGRGLILQEAASMKIGLAAGMSQGIAVLEKEWWGYPGVWMLVRYFPIDSALCKRNWEYGELGMYLLRYASQVFREN